MSDLSQRNRKRIDQAMRGEMPDATPFYLFTSYPFVMSATGVDIKDYFKKPEVMLEKQVELFEKLDGCMDFFPDYPLLPEPTALGCKMQYDGAGMPGIHPLQINDLDDVLKMKPADPYGGSIMTNALEALEYMRDHAPVDEGCELLPPILTGPFTAAAMSRGISEFCMDLYMEPDIVRALLDLVIETQIAYLKAQEKILGKLRKIIMADDISSFLSVEFFHKYVAPCYDRIFSEFPVECKWLHNDANASHIAADILSYGFNAWHCGFCIDMIKAAKTVPDRKTAMLGNIVPIDQLLKPAPDEVELNCNKMIDKYENDPRFILSTGGYISYGTPIENVKALIHAADSRKRS